MEVKVGMQNVARELVLNTMIAPDEIEKEFIQACGDNGILRLTTESGGTVLIPAAGIAYLDLGHENTRQVGFGAV